MMNVKYLSKDQNWMDEQTIYWFSIDGLDTSTDTDFNNDVYGIVESGGLETGVVNEDGFPLNEGDDETELVSSLCNVTDEYRMD